MVTNSFDFALRMLLHLVAEGQVASGVMDPLKGEWQGLQGLPAQGWTCGFCDQATGRDVGYAATVLQIDRTKRVAASICVCSHCNRPTLFAPGGHFPQVPPGQPVSHLPDDVNDLYNEARRCAGAGAHTAAVMLCRKLLMNVAVTKNADTNKSFAFYVNYLEQEHYIPPDGKGWVDYIRCKGNEANHEIALMSRKDAEALLKFTEGLLRFVFEFSKDVPPPPTP